MQILPSDPLNQALWRRASPPGGSGARSLPSAPRQLATGCFFSFLMRADVHPSQLHVSHGEPDIVSHLITVCCPGISSLLVLLLVLVQRSVFLIFKPADFSLAFPLCIVFIISVFRA